MHNVPARSSRVLLVVIAVAAFITVGEARRSDAAGAAPAAKKAAPAQKAPAKTKAALPQPVPAKEALKEMVEGEDVREFRAFCDSWMEKLRDRDSYNVAHITWEKGSAGGVVGEYLSYGTARTCIAREESGKDPIGKITYREVRYRRQGATPTAAMSGGGTIVEQTDVTEIFRYGKGRWQY